MNFPQTPDSHALHPSGVLGPNLFGNRMELTVHPDHEGALREWRELEQRVKSDSVSCSWEWTSGWIRHFGDQVPHRILTAREQGIVRGMCLVTYPEEVEGPFTVRTVHLGTAGEPDADSLCIEYNRLLVDEVYRTPMAFSLLKYLREDESWDQLRFEGLAEEEAGVLVKAEPQFELRTAESPYCDLRIARASGEPLLMQFNGNRKKDLKRKLNLWGSLNTEWGETVDQGIEIYEELVRLHQSRWVEAGEPGSFASERFREFHREMIATLMPQKKVAIARVVSGATTVGCVLCYIERNSLLFYQLGVNCEHGKLSPGMIAMYCVMEEAIWRGYDRFDFLAGEGEHKRRLSTGSNTLVWASYQRPRMKLTLIRNLRAAKRLLAT